MSTAFSRGIGPVVFVLGLLAFPCFAAVTEVVYDSTPAITDSWQTTTQGAIQDRGVEMLLAGTARTLLRAEIGVTLQGVPGTIDVKAKVWANDGPSQEPGTLLWESPWIEDVSIVGWSQLVPFDIPYIAVPDHITVTIAEKNCTTGLLYGEPLASSTTVGTTVRNWTHQSTGEWTQLEWSKPAAMRITAVPEPVTLALLAAGVGALWLKRRRKA